MPEVYNPFKVLKELIKVDSPISVFREELSCYIDTLNTYLNHNGYMIVCVKSEDANYNSEDCLNEILKDK